MIDGTEAGLHPICPGGAGCGHRGQAASRLFSERTLLSVLPEVVRARWSCTTPSGKSFCQRPLHGYGYPDKQRDEVYGLRPGEALGCIHASKDPGGCGVTSSAASAAPSGPFWPAAWRRRRSRVPHPRGKTHEALDLRSGPVPWKWRRAVLGLCGSGYQSREAAQALERVFLHDIHIVACGLSWSVGFLQKAGPEDGEHYSTTFGVCLAS